MSFKEFDMSEYFNAMEEFKKEHKDKIMKALEDKQPKVETLYEKLTSVISNVNIIMYIRISRKSLDLVVNRKYNVFD